MLLFHAFTIKSTSLVSLTVIIALCCSGAALGIHYSVASGNLEVSISNPGTIIEDHTIHFNPLVIGGSGKYTYSWFINSTFYSSSRDANLTFYNPGLHVVILDVSSPGGYSGSDMILIHVYSEPDVFITSNITNARLGERVGFYSHIAGGIGPYFYTWYSNGKGVKSGFNLSEISLIFNSTGSYNIGLKVNNSLGFSGSTTYSFDPWGFSETIKPKVRPGYGENNAMADVQDNNASGNLSFHFYLYNPTSSSGINNITVSLYDLLPPNGPNSPPVMKFTFSSGVVSAKSGKWVNVYPNIYWNYSSIAVIPQTQTGISGDAIGVANPAHFNNIFSHYWVPGWDGTDDGFVGYWTVSHNLTISVG